MKLIRKTTISLLFVFFSLTILSSCNKEDLSQKAVASVDGRPVSKSNYSNELEFYLEYYTKKYGESFLQSKAKANKTNKELIEDKLLDSMIKDQIMLNDLDKNGYEIDDNAANKLKDEMAKSLADKNSLKANFKALNVDEGEFSDLVFNDSIRKLHYEYFLTHNNIKDSEVLEDFKDNKKLHRMYKYNILIFDDRKSAEIKRESIKSFKDFKDLLKNPVRNYSIYNSDFVYEDDPILVKSKVKEKNKPSEVFEHEGKFMILMVNSYNDNENELLLNAKDIYLKNAYENYLNKLIKSSKIKVFV